MMGSYIPSRQEMDDILFRLCDGSVYAHEETLCQGFVRGREGVRVGVCGRAVCRGGSISALHGITSLCIRLPSRLCSFGGAVTPYPELLKVAPEGLLICSPPGIGKTTALRYTARGLLKEGKRVAVIDSRGELSPGLDLPDQPADILDGYPRGKGIEIAIRVMCPDALVCDEVGSEEDCLALMEAVGAGVAVIATAHGASVADALGRPGLRRLCSTGIFHHVAFLERNGSERCKCRIEEVGAFDL